MGILDLFRRSAPISNSVATLERVLTDYDVVDVEHNAAGSYLIVTDKKQFVEVPDFRELGTASPTRYISFERREYNSKLIGQAGLKIFNQMRKSDGTIQGTLRIVKTPVLAARWFVAPKDKDSKRDQNAADFVWSCLTDYMSISWTQILVEALLCLDFGYYMFEKVWEERIIDGKKRVILSKLAPRHPMDVIRWEYNEKGGPEGVVMQVTTSAGSYKEVFIPIEKLLVFTFNREGNDMQGTSVLRSAYKHWYFKEQLYKIDAIQKERHGIGIPVIKLPPGFTPSDKNEANNLGRNLRTNERAHVVLPPNWELLFAKIEGNPVDALKSIDHHDERIRENVLAVFSGANTTTKEEDHTMFLKATRYVADIVCDVINLYLIPDLVKYNFDRVGIPKLKARRIGEQADWRTLSFAIRNLIGSGVIRPDDRLEAWIRDEMDLPEPDLATIRIVQAPQIGSGAPPNATLPNATPGVGDAQSIPTTKQDTNNNSVGLPRQTPLPPVGLQKTNAGLDASGGR